MKKRILIAIILFIYAIVCVYSVKAQSTFNTETLTTAIENYVKQQKPSITKVEIKQTLNPQKFSQKNVVATITHTGNLVGNSKVNLIFKYNDLILTNLPVKINTISMQANNNKNEFKEVQIQKGQKVKLLHYSGAICIKTDGVAMESGSTGDVIKVKKDNIQTLYGFIAEDGNVIIENKNILVNNN